MKRLHVVLSVCCVVLLALSLVVPLAAQDATATPEGTGDTTATPEGTGDTTGDTTGQTGTLTNCDSSLILLAGLAQRYFGFNSDAMLDMSTYEYGQFRPLFDMSAGAGTGSDTGSTGGDTTATQAPDASATDTGSTGGDTAATQAPDASATDTGSTSGDTGTTGDTGSGVFLNPPVITDEDPFCIQLRSSLDSFFFSEFQTQDWDMRFRGGMSGVGTGSQ